MANKRSADWARNFVTMNYDQARIVGLWAWSFLDKDGRVRHATFDSSEFIVNRLMRLTVETGLACALTALLELAFFLGLPNTNVHIAL